MGTDIETFMCLLEHNTKYMENLLYNNPKNIAELPDVVEAVEIMEYFERFKNIEDIKKANNIHINKAIEELENNKELMKILKEETNLYN